MDTVFEDPITFEVMTQAVIAPCGHSFSEESIRAWLAQHNMCPTCKEQLSVEQLKPNYVLRHAIDQFLKLQQEASAKNNNNNSVSAGSPPPPPAVGLLADSLANSGANRIAFGLPPSVVIKEIHPSHVEIASAVLEVAFREDPWINYFYSNHESYKTTAMRWFLGRMLTYGIQSGRVWAAYDGETLKGIALWQPPYESGTTAWGMIKAGMAAAPFKMGIKATVKALSVLDYTEVMRKQTVTTPHWSLYTIGVLPSDQNKGLGAAMMAPILAVADNAKLPVYLDTSSKRSLKFFNKMGFKTAIDVTDPPNGPRFWTMLRSARSSTNSNIVSISSPSNNDPPLSPSRGGVLSC